MYSLIFTGFLNNIELTIFGCHQECNQSLVLHKRSATELRQPADKETHEFCLYTAKGYCSATVSLSTDKDYFYSLTFLFHKFITL